jgi:hypothetical protein
MRRFLVAVAVPVICALACDDAPTSHQYLALLYEPPSGSNGANGCLETSTALGAVPGESGSLLCAPTCLVATAPGGATTYYASTMCGPYPASLTTADASDPTCASALAAYAQYAVDNCACGGSCGGGDDGGGDDGGTGDGATGDDAPGDDGSSGDDGNSGDDARGDGASSGDDGGSTDAGSTNDGAGGG